MASHLIHYVMGVTALLPFLALLTSLSPPRPPLSHPLLFTTCTGTDSLLSPHDTSICSTAERRMECWHFIFYVFYNVFYIYILSGSRRLTPLQVEFQRLEVWHLNTEPAGLMYTWRRSYKHMHVPAVVGDSACMCVWLCLWPWENRSS